MVLVFETTDLSKALRDFQNFYFPRWCMFGLKRKGGFLPLLKTKAKLFFVLAKILCLKKENPVEGFKIDFRFSILIHKIILKCKFHNAHLCIDFINTCFSLFYAFSKTSKIRNLAFRKSQN